MHLIHLVMLVVSESTCSACDDACESVYHSAACDLLQAHRPAVQASVPCTAV